MRIRAFAAMVAAIGCGGGCGDLLGFERPPKPSDCLKDSDCAAGICRKYVCVSPQGGTAGTAGEGGISGRGDLGGGATSEGGTTKGGGNTGVCDGGCPGGGAGRPGGGGTGAVASGSGGTPKPGTSGGNAGTGADCLTITPWPPPAPCRGHHYDVGLTVEGGEAPYTWTAPSLPDGLTLSASGHLSGTAASPGPLTIRVEDGTTLCTGEQTTPLFEPRDTCWLAYVADEQGRNQLFLYDPVLRDYSGSTYKLAFPSSTEETANVTDFRFSPDGRFLAYRLDEAPARLMLLSGPTWAEEELDFDQGSVLEYAWSPDSSVLAVAFASSDDGATYLGGVRVPDAPSSSGEGGAAGATGAGGAPGAQLLEPIPAQVDSELVWFAPDWLVFHAPWNGPDSGHEPHISKLAENRFASDIRLDHLTYRPPLQLLPADGGFYALEEDWQVTYWEVPPDADEENVALYSRHALLASPSGQYVAVSREVSGEDGAGTARGVDVYANNGQDPVATAESCPALLAWSGTNEQIACLADGPGGTSTIFIHQFATANPPLTSEVKGNYQYLEGQAFEQRRAFSDQGTRFAFASHSLTDPETYVYVALLQGGSPRLDVSTPTALPSEESSAELAFAPDGLALLIHLDDQLYWRDPDSSSTPPPLNLPDQPLAPPAPCDESFVTAPDRWCGNSRQVSAEFAWSPDSRWVAFRADDHELVVVDVMRAPSTISDPIATCVGRCQSSYLGPFEFQN